MNEKIKHLPHVRQQLNKVVEKIDKDIRMRAYEKALGNISFLEEQQFFYPDLYKNKLFCLRKLERWDEVESISELLLEKKKDPNAAEYFLYYLTSLYQRQQYELVIELIKERKTDATFTKEHRAYLVHLYNECFHKVSKKLNEIYKKLQLAIISKNEPEQWVLINKWKLLNAQPSKLIIQMLSLDEVHPIVKTNILVTLKERNIDEKISVIKNNRKLENNVSNILPLEQQPLFIETLKHLQVIEQKDPTLFSLVNELLQPYFEYEYPFLDHIEESELIAIAAISMAELQLTGETSFDVTGDEAIYAFQKRIKKSYESFLRLTLS